MKHTIVILFLLTVCVSCNSFQHAQYRKVKKVPADNSWITAARSESQHRAEPQAEDSIAQSIVEVTPAIIDSSDETAVVITTQNISQPEAIPRPVVQRVKKEFNPGHRELHRDWSWLIALLMILGAVFLLVYIAFVVPYIGIYPLLRIVLGIFMLYTAIRLLVTGFAILRNRVRKPETYKES